MLIYPAIDEMMDIVENRYTLVVVAAKRARVIAADQAVKVAEANSNNAKPVISTEKPVTTAANEIYKGKLTYHHTK